MHSGAITESIIVRSAFKLQQSMNVAAALDHYQRHGIVPMASRLDYFVVTIFDTLTDSGC